MHQPPERKWVESTVRIEQVDLEAGFRENGYKLPLAAQHRGFELEMLAVGVREQRQEVIFGATPVQRRDQLQDADAVIQPPELPVRPINWKAATPSGVAT
jgi:hypothetical protein